MTQNLFQDELQLLKEHFKKYFEYETSNQDVKERQTIKLTYRKQNEENKRPNLSRKNKKFQIEVNQKLLLL